MKSTILLSFISAFVLAIVLAAPPAREAGAGCTPWVFGECQQLNKGTCGRGVKTGTRSGEGCTNKEKTESCKVPCSDKKACKYRPGKYGECDQLTLKRTRVDTLMVELSDPSCESTKKLEKICKKKCGYGAWTEGECKNGKTIMTRPITSGGDECRRKATKTKRCGGGAGGNGGRRRGGNNRE